MKMSNTLFEAVKSIAADLFMVSSRDLTAGSSADNLERWDSIQHLNLLLALEQKFGVHFDVDELQQMRTIGDIVLVLENKQARMELH